MNKNVEELVATLDHIVYPPICATAAAALREQAGEIERQMGIVVDMRKLNSSVIAERDDLKKDLDRAINHCVTPERCGLKKFTDGHGNDITDLTEEKYPGKVSSVFGASATLYKRGGVVTSVWLDRVEIPQVARAEIVINAGESSRLILTINLNEVHTVSE